VVGSKGRVFASINPDFDMYGLSLWYVPTRQRSTGRQASIDFEERYYSRGAPSAYN